jgi:glycosyltransferase involved in cell wall biosynthesis
MRVAVLIPCLDEARAIASVIEEFRRELPAAAIWVIDNGSIDDTALIASGAGANVLREPRRGKGFAIRAAFVEIDADVYVLADGDGQLRPEYVHQVIGPIIEGQADMVVGSRAIDGRTSPYLVNNIGNVVFSRLLRSLLGVRVTDVLSGYRAMNRALVKGLPLTARNFEIEVELTIKTSLRSYRIREVPVTVRPRPPGTASHLNPLRDGARIMWAIVLFFRDYRPMAFFGLLGVLLVALGLFMFGLLDGRPVFGLIPANTASALAVAAGFLSVAVGAVLSVLARRFAELEGKLDMAAGRDPYQMEDRPD